MGCAWRVWGVSRMRPLPTSAQARRWGLRDPRKYIAVGVGWRRPRRARRRPGGRQRAGIVVAHRGPRCLPCLLWRTWQLMRFGCRHSLWRWRFHAVRRARLRSWCRPGLGTDAFGVPGSHFLCQSLGLMTGVTGNVCKPRELRVHRRSDPQQYAAVGVGLWWVGRARGLLCWRVLPLRSIVHEGQIQFRR